ncbi:MAG: AmmeMemoRadiSam system protein B [Patescibacteria group bacterium]
MKRLSLIGLCVLATFALPVYATHADTARPIAAQFPDKGLFLGALDRSTAALAHGKVTGITVPHHLLARDLIADAFKAAASPSVTRVIIVGPDHFFRGSSAISVTTRDFHTPFGILSNDQDAVRKLLATPDVSDGNFFYREHGIGALTPFVRLAFPNAQVVPIVIKEGTPQHKLAPFVATLKNLIDDQTLIVQSTDFSHYLTKEVADVKDQETIRVLTSGRPTDLFSLNEPENLDSIASQYIQMRLQAEAFKSTLSILANKNSQSYTKKRVERTTSYITQLYSPDTRSDTLLAVGDIMLGRSVESLMKRFGSDYPFTDTKTLLKSSRVVVGNLEGPITTDHRQTPDGSLHFSFPSSTAAVLANTGFTHLSLGNNHTGDAGLQNLAFTRKTLKQAGLTPFGDPRTINEADGVAHINLDGIPASLLSINAARQNAPISHTQKLIAQEKKSGNRVIVFIHWGSEYSLTPNVGQREMAHAAINAGADMIIGHHPHVVQSIERYRGRIIVYSLGNFIFDQYFSPDTQEGLAVLLDRIGLNLIPLSSKKSIPSPMAEPKKSRFLQRLADRSDRTLADQIKRGVIHVD